MILERRDQPGQATEILGVAAGSSEPAPLPVTLACRRYVHRHVRKLLLRYVGVHQIPRLRGATSAAADLLVHDLMALTARDPAAQASWEYVAHSYASYQAVSAYRLAHAILTGGSSGVTGWDAERARLARRISEDAKVRTGTEIHPAATIGQRFALDHATGTVIGETAVLGNDCYILQGVILGAIGIAGNSTGKRHPTLGDRVEVGAFARLLGPIVVGSDTRICPHAVLVTSVPAYSQVRLMNQCQIRGPHSTLEVYGVVPIGTDWLEVHGTGLADADLTVVDATDNEIHACGVQIIERAAARLTCRITGGRAVPMSAALRITEPSGERVLITQLRAVWRALHKSST
jgi:serine O-acetyltransferase